jgi:hypothetical protein
MAGELGIIISFIVSWIVSTIIIFVVTKFFGESEGIGHALKAAIAGSIIYALAYFFLGGLGSIIGGIVWLLALKGLYKIGWGKALVVAIVVWILAGLVGLVLPTLTGPL